MRLNSLSASSNMPGVRVVLCGKTNAGKSSLFNALLKEDRAIVSDIEGTTRDYLESWASFDGIPARIFDTAGLRRTDDAIEAEGVERTKDLSGEADLILYLSDATVGIQKDDEDFLSIARDMPVVLVWNKCDSEKKNPLPSPELLEKMHIAAAVEISAKKGNGIGDLCKSVKSILMKSDEENRNQTGLGSDRQKKSVEEALERVDHALIAAESGLALDAVVQDLEDSLDSLGEVTGEVTPDDILESIFSNFCVGK